MKEDLRVTHGAVLNALMSLRQPEGQTATRFATKFRTLLRDCAVDDNTAKTLLYQALNETTAVALGRKVEAYVDSLTMTATSPPERALTSQQKWDKCTLQDILHLLSTTDLKDAVKAKARVDSFLGDPTKLSSSTPSSPKAKKKVTLDPATRIREASKDLEAALAGLSGATTKQPTIQDLARQLLDQIPTSPTSSSLPFVGMASGATQRYDQIETDLGQDHPYINNNYTLPRSQRASR